MRLQLRLFERFGVDLACFSYSVGMVGYRPRDLAMPIDRFTTATISQLGQSIIFSIATILFWTLVPSSNTFAREGTSSPSFTSKHNGVDSGGPMLMDLGIPDSSNAVANSINSIAAALNELQADVLTGPMLEKAIVRSRNDAISGSMPIPPDIRQQLTGYATEDSMNRVRYKIGNGGSLNLALLLEGGFADAVTLIDVVVFREAKAAANVSAWAHELTHIDQFRDWGVHGFAVQYARNWRAVENPAYAKGYGFCNWLQSRKASAFLRNIRRAQRLTIPTECTSGSRDD